MNAQTMLDLVKRRVPGYTDAEYLSELNQSYEDVWTEVMKLDENFCTDIQVLTITTQTDELDLRYDTPNVFSGVNLSRLAQIVQVRVKPPGSDTWQPGNPRVFGSDDFLRQRRNSVAIGATDGPYLYVPFAQGHLKFGQPLAVNTQIEITYEFSLVPLAITSAGTVASSGTAVTGTGTNFNAILPPDYGGLQPGLSDNKITVEEELVVTADGRVHQVATVSSATALTVRTAILPTLSAAAFSLAIVPSLPLYGHSVIVDVATRNILSTPAEDERFGEWAAIAENSMENMIAILTGRQRQRHSRKARFPFGARRARVG